jgi:hypothetical protein
MEAKKNLRTIDEFNSKIHHLDPDTLLIEDTCEVIIG